MNSEIQITQSDITNLDVDAIVNAANSRLAGGGGVDGAIHRAAGEELDEACEKIGGCKTGEAVITKGFKLKAKYIIHAVGPIYKKDSELIPVLLRNCYLNSLNLSKENNIHSIAFPNISTGIYGYPKLEAAEIAIRAVIDWIKNNKDYEIKIIFCCFDKENFEIYSNLTK